MVQDGPNELDVANLVKSWDPDFISLLGIITIDMELLQPLIKILGNTITNILTHI